jgi:hypothetical protein
VARKRVKREVIIVSLTMLLWIIGIFAFFSIAIILFITIGFPRLMKYLKKKFTPNYRTGMARINEGGIEKEYASTWLYETPIAITYRRNQKINGEWVEDHFPLKKYDKEGKVIGDNNIVLHGELGCHVYRVDLGNSVGYPDGESPSYFPQRQFNIHRRSCIVSDYNNSVQGRKGGLDWKIILLLVGIVAVVGIVAMGLGVFKKQAPINVYTANNTANTTQTYTPPPAAGGPVLVGNTTGVK